MRRDRSLIESLKEDAVEASYRERVRGRVASRARSGGLSSLQRELLGEMASALGRAEAHVLHALGELRRLDEEHATLVREAREPSAIGAAIDAFNAQRAVAERRLWELMVHREALGLFQHDLLSRHYPLPPKKKRLALADVR